MTTKTVVIGIVIIAAGSFGLYWGIKRLRKQNPPVENKSLPLVNVVSVDWNSGSANLSIDGQPKYIATDAPVQGDGYKIEMNEAAITMYDDRGAVSLVVATKPN